jgi:hypothetical protein
MTQEQIQASLVKAASIGMTQELINRGATEEQAAHITMAYAHPQNGLLVKRAAALENMRQNVATVVNAIRSNY